MDSHSPASSGYDLINPDAQRCAAEAALRADEQRFRSLTRLSSDWYWETDKDARFTYLSEGTSDLLGYSAAEMLGKTRLDVAATPDQPGLHEYAKKIAAREAFKNIRYQSIEKNGTVHVLNISGEPLFAQGEFQGYWGVGRDLTGEVAVAETLAQLAAENKLLVENALDLIVVAGLDGRYVRINGPVKDIVGYEPHELIGRHFLDFIAPDEIDETAAKVASVIDGTIAMRDLEQHVVHKDGSARYIAWSVRLMEGGKYIQGYGRDVTQRRAAQDALRASEQRFRSLAGMSSDWYWETDERDRLTYLSDGARVVVRCSPGERLGRSRLDAPARASQPAMREYAEKIARREPFRDIRYEYTAHDGSLHYPVISGEPVFHNGQFKGYRGVGRDLTDEIAAKQQFEQLAAENHLLLENSLDMIVTAGQDGCFVRVNGPVRDIVGYEADDIIGRCLLEFIPPHEVERTAAMVASVFASGDPVRDFEQPVLHKDGSYRYISWSVRLMEDGKLIHGAGRDITQRYAAEAALRNSEQRFRSLTNLSSDWFWETDESDCFTFFSEGLQRRTGRDPKELLGRSRFAVAKMQPSLQECAEKIARREPFKDIVYEVIAPDGAVFYPSTSGEPMFEAGVFKGYRGVGRDLTEKVADKKRLDQLAAENQLLFESSVDMMALCDRNGYFLRANKASQELLGYAPEELIGRHFLEFTRADSHEQLAAAAARLGSATDTLNDVESGGLHKDGRVVPISWSVRLLDAGNRIFAVGRDITQRHAVENAIRDSEQRVREVIEMTPAGYVLADAQSLILAVNPALCTITGYAPDELIGQQLDKLFHARRGNDVLSMQGQGTSVHGEEAVLRHREGHLVYVLVYANVQRDRAGNGVSVTAFLTDITERKQAETRLEQLATHDTLTGLPNRARLNDYVHQAIDGAHGAPFAVLFIDLDRFKEVNDSMGHRHGDTLLREVARRLRSHLRSDDIIARIGGDEFVVVAQCAKGRDSAAKVAQTLLLALAAPTRINGQEVFIGASIGISMYPEDASDRELLFQSADTAMYRAKNAGRNCYRFFDTGMSIEAKTRMAIEHSLPRALERKEFEVVYQPRISLETMGIVGTEALIRWHHPQLGLVPPMQFIPVAEELGLIESIGRWVLEEACMRTRQLIDRFQRPLRVSVNLSAHQLRSQDIVEQVRTCLQSTGLAPELLELELTESVLIDDVEGSAKVLKELKALGILLSIDDFGTGYSSLAYLRSFPIDTLKLDRSFVLPQPGAKNSFQFIKAFVDMAHALGLSVVAEGVETAETLEFLRQAASDEAQGYLFAKPMPHQELTAYLMRLPPYCP